MQGTLDEIDIRSILQLLELGQRTGELYIEAYPNASFSPRSWCLFFINGQIAYAVEQTNLPLSRLQDYLYPDKIVVPSAIDRDSSSIAIDYSEYTYLWQLLSDNTLQPPRGREILQAMIRETLFDLLSLRQGSFLFETTGAIAPQPPTLALAPLLPILARQAQHWQQFYPQIQQADQFLVIARARELQAALPEKAYRNLTGWASQKTTLRQLSRYLKRDLVIIARNLYPYAQRGWLHLVSPPSESTSSSVAMTPRDVTARSPHIVSIEDDPIVRETVERVIERDNYRYTQFRDPLEALSQVFEIEPDVIVCDLALPPLDGYELCAMLRQCHRFRSLPIILVTGSETGIDRVKAKMVGATQTLSIPFGQPELSLLLAEYT
jgi:twitching motility two-component system response regulator PilG